jgi:hypothetical protein
MTTKNEYTKGKWVVGGTKIDCNGRLVANTGGYSNNYSFPRKENEGNALLICALVNAAQEIGEPMKVAEKMVRTFNEHDKAYNALIIARNCLRKDTPKVTVDWIESVLSAIEKE